jgi:predicted DNA-binding WGR domain protein
VVAETEALTYAKGGDAGHKFSWEIDLTQVTLANLNYKKMSLVRDFAELIDRPVTQPAFDQVFSIEPRPFIQEAPPAIPPTEQWNVVPADATQDAAVALARTGRCFIIQGPPGTGKSQTITNLIADYAGRGKRVLFVCEKRAALDVVFHRLGQAELDGLACIIHDSQEDKKSFIGDLKGQYEHWGKNNDRLNHFQKVRGRTASALEQHLEAIASYDKAVGTADQKQESLSLRELVRRAAALPPSPEGLGPQLREDLPSLRVWDAHLHLAERTVRAVYDCSGLDRLSAHPFALINARTVCGERPYATVEAMIDGAEVILQRLDRWLEGGSSVVSSTTPLAAANEICALAERLVGTGLGRSLDLLDPASAGSAELQTELAGIARLDSAYAKAARRAANWLDPLTPGDTDAALELARSKEKSFFRFLSGQWRALKKSVRARYDFSSHTVVPSITSLLETLAARHEAAAAVEAGKEVLQTRLQTADLDGLLSLRDELLIGQRHSALTARMLQTALTSGLPNETLILEAQEAGEIRQLLSVVGDVLDGVGSYTFDQLAELLRELREALDDLPDMLPALGEVHRGDKGFALTMRSIPLPLPALEALIVDEAIARIERADPEIKRFDIDRLIAVSRRAAAARENLRAENADAIRATLHRKFRDNVKTSEASVTQLDNAGRHFKKTYATGRRVLEHEFGKTMRYRSIRDLASGESGLVVNDLKPIWLMSPLSVSDTLPLRPDLFDVVIFDEASQIPTEEAVPALCRSNQVIIVGDEMQLPPTSFFSTSLDEEDKQVFAEEDGEKIAILLDADSLLNQAGRNLPATLLAWHYRSRFEALIGFSNAAFYNGQLVTIPDRTLRAHQQPVAPVQSNDETAWQLGVSRLLAAPITTHRIADGLYEGRINPPEARHIAGLVRELLARETGQSLGVVAFSEAQQSEIEDALARLAADDPAFATALEREYTREDDGQFNGLFVKNLENVQGDERDIILMSVCYAPGRDGRMAMSFGPINQRGGEKRLNVIFSRARRHMAIVSTIAPEAITNVHNDGARALRGFLSFAEAQSNGAHHHAQAVLTTLNPDAARTFGDELPPDPVRHAIAEALRGRGHIVHEHVGGASFRCDLAIVDAVGDCYALAILLDRDANKAGAVEERFVFRPGILRAFGWRVLDIPVAAWLRAREAIIERIESELARSSWELADPNPFCGVARPPETPPAARPTGSSAPVAQPTLITGGSVTLPVQAPIAITPTESPNPPQASVETKLTEFRFVEGSSNKFWRVGVNGCELTVEFGRVGTKGQRVVKTFDDEERAKREAVKLTLEKTRKGYQEVG